MTSMVNHVTHLHDRAALFADPVARGSALEEIVRHAAGERVSSESAQHAWNVRWRQRVPDDGEWLAALARWRAGP